MVCRGGKVSIMSLFSSLICTWPSSKLNIFMTYPCCLNQCYFLKGSFGILSWDNIRRLKISPNQQEKSWVNLYLQRIHLWQVILLMKLGLFWQGLSKLILTSTRRSNALVFTKNKVRLAVFAYISLSVLINLWWLEKSNHFWACKMSGVYL